MKWAVENVYVCVCRLDRMNETMRLKTNAIASNELKWARNGSATIFSQQSVYVR